MKIEEIRWMTELFKSGQISKTAETLFISQPALSQCLKRIEAELGFSLFERSNKGLIPTERGCLFYKTAMEITDNYQKFLMQTALLDQSELQQITIEMGPNLSRCCSAELIHQLQSTCPQIRFSVHEATCLEMIQDLRDNIVQIVVTKDHTAIYGIIPHRFGCVPNVILLRKGSPAAQYVYVEKGKQYLDPKYLADEPLALTKRDQSSRQIAENLIAEAGFEPHVQYESRLLSTLYQYAFEGIASSIIPFTRVEDIRDQDTHLVHWVPASYRWASFRNVILVRPEIDRIVPKKVYETIKAIVTKNDMSIKSCLISENR